MLGGELDGFSSGGETKLVGAGHPVHGVVMIPKPNGL